MGEQEGTHRNRAVLQRMMEIVTNGEYAALEEVLHPDFVQEIPQSGERVLGIENFRKILENLPGTGSGLRIADEPYIAGDEEHYVMTPTFNVVKIEGTGDELTSYAEARYPDGSDWYIITLSSYKDGKIIKRVDFYAPFFDPPEWRSEWVEKG
jgi:ketosteroid isomerase-like protein